MAGKTLIAVWVSLAFLNPGSVQAADFTLGFDGCPQSPVAGAPGEVKTFEIFPTLTTSGNESIDGVQGWAIGVSISGGSLQSIAVKGVVIDAIYTEYVSGGENLRHDHYPIELGAVFTGIASPAAKLDDPSRKGAISAVIPDPVGPDRRRTGFATLQPNGRVRIAKMVVAAEIPEDGAEHEVVLKYEDGFKSAVGQPVNNVATFGGSQNDPLLGECRFTLVKGTPSMQVPGDSDQSGALDLSDAISIFGTLFLGDPQRFPCGDGSPSDSGNKALLDWQNDGAIDITDGIAALQHLFLGGPAHRLAVPGNELRGCVPMYGCPEGASCR